jgi:hypothetical protein
LAPSASARVDVRVVDRRVVAGEHNRGVDLRDSTAESLTVGPHDVRRDDVAGDHMDVAQG